MKFSLTCLPTANRAAALAALVSAIAAVCVICPVPVLADQPPTQYANIAPLPGGGTALSPEGKLDGAGAVQVNIPVAYTPGEGYYNVSVFGGDHIGQFDNTFDSGSGVFGAGFGTWPRFYISAFQVSSLLFREDKAVNAQVQMLEQTATRPAVAIGVQDMLDKEKAAGNAQSFYGVATKSVRACNRDIYLTAGYGNGRFLNKVFGGVSVPINDHLNLAVEYDGFQMNEALAWRPGGRYGNFTIIGGYNNKAGMLLGGTLANKMPTWTEVTIGGVLLVSSLLN